MPKSKKDKQGAARFEAYYAQQHLVDDLPQLLEALRKPLPITFRIFDATRDGIERRRGRAFTTMNCWSQEKHI